jgi:hypothetical protein
MSNSIKRFAAGIDLKRWCIGLQVHDMRRRIGYIIAEINILPLTFYLRFGDGTKKLHCMYCRKYLGKVDPSENGAFYCMECYMRNRKEGGEEDGGKEREC